MLSRRAVVGRLAIGTAAVCAAGVSRVASGATKPETEASGSSALGQDVSATSGPVVDSGPAATAAAEAPWPLVSPLAAGSLLADGWQLAELRGAVDGAGVLTLRNRNGRECRVHICRNDGQPQGLAYSRHFDLVVMNGGQGDLPTEEGLAQAVARVARVLADNERQPLDAPLVAALMSHAERVALYSGAVDRRLR